MIIQGRDVSNKILAEVKDIISKNKLEIHTVALYFKGDEESKVYFQSIKKNADKVGIDFRITEIGSENLIEEIKRLNDDQGIDSIIIARPFPEGVNSVEVSETIDPDKDLDCISPYNLGRLNYKDYDVAPATAKAAIDILKYNGIKLSGMNSLIINRSITVGRPLSQMLLNEDSTITVAHSKTKNIEELIENNDIVFLAVGKPGYLKANSIKNKKIIVDIGINVVDKKVVGDFEVDGKLDQIDYTPVPGGVGTVTSAEILMNALRLKMRS